MMFLTWVGLAQGEAGTVRVEGTSVTMMPPVGFVEVKGRGFLGFQQEATHSAIMVTEMPAPPTKAASGFADQQKMAASGMKLISSQAVKAGGKPAQLYHIKQTIAGQSILKWCLIQGNETKSVMVLALCPESQSKMGPALLQSLQSVQWNAQGEAPIDEGLSFTINGHGALKPVKRMGAMLMLTRGAFPIKSIDEPRMIAGPSAAKVEIKDMKAFALARIKKTVTVKQVVVEEIKLVSIDKSEGFEIVAKAQDERSGKPIAVYQVALPDKAGYFLIWGMVSAGNKDKYLESFKKIARSLKRK